MYYLGLTESSIRQRRHSADDTLIIGLHKSNQINDDLTNIENLAELKEIIRNLRKYIYQLQMRVRISTPDLLQSPTIEKLNDEVQVMILNLNKKTKYRILRFLEFKSCY